VQPQEPARSHGAWNSTAVRLAGLLVCLGVLVLVLVARTGGDDGGARAAASSDRLGACTQNMPSAATIGFGELVKLRATLLAAMARAGGRRYEGGTAPAAAFWTDGSPQPIAGAWRGPDVAGEV
jgi:hypothetical protein